MRGGCGRFRRVDRSLELCVVHDVALGDSRLRCVRHLDISYVRHHDDSMRTTLTLDRDVAESLNKEMRRTGRGLKVTINDALRRGLRIAGKSGRTPRFEVRPHMFGVKPGFDLDRMNQLVDELEATEFARKLGR
jgi:hypothetical protein